MNRTVIPVFLSCDERYLPFLAVSVRSLIDNASPENRYEITVLYTEVCEESRKRVQSMETDFCSIRFVDVNEAIAPVMSHFRLRDYYSIAIYYRLFIPTLFPEYDKAVYLDCDVVLERDVADLFATELGDSMLVGVVRDEIVADTPPFQEYVRRHVGVPDDEYFNSGVMVMNLALFRRLDITGKFARALKKYAFPSVAPDQDYLNALCNGRVVYLEKAWNLMFSPHPYDGPVYLVHYNMFLKPWLYHGVPREEYFWKYAVRTDYCDDLRAMQHAYTPEQREKDDQALAAMLSATDAYMNGDNTFAAKLAADPMMEALKL
ncbi:MAG: glycosyltransferase family 8 protein [Clostridia bacterium]|nr:glycosyltransferase family 8 protein [Clostridia bacterium]